MTPTPQPAPTGVEATALHVLAVLAGIVLAVVGVALPSQATAVQAAFVAVGGVITAVGLAAHALITVFKGKL